MSVIIATGEVEVGRIVVGSQPGHILLITKTPSQPKKLGMVVCACLPTYVRSINRRTVIRAGLSINIRPYFKNT
jgi:hypothetical protein